jgi:Skp family chaperone for outer membrane proteins
MQRSVPAVRKLILTATGLLCLAGGSYVLSDAWGQEKRPAKEPAEDVPHRVGLIDVGYVFAKYEKLKYDREELMAEAKEVEAKLKAKQKKGLELTEEMREFAEDSPDFESRRARLVKMSTDFESETKLVKMDFQRKEAKVLHTAYLEVQDAVEKFCNQYKFTVIIRFQRADSSSTDPQRVNQLMNQTVVYHRNRDDLTDGVLKYLNDKYMKSAGGEARSVTDKPAKKDSKVKTVGGTKSAD